MHTKSLELHKSELVKHAEQAKLTFLEKQDEKLEDSETSKENKDKSNIWNGIHERANNDTVCFSVL
jgi:hypothetical protein